MLSLFAPGSLMENVVVEGVACLSSLVSNFVPKQCHLEEASHSSGVRFVFRLVEGQTLPVVTGFSKYISCIVFVPG